MSTENEGTAVPPAPSAPPVPVDAPAASAPQEQPPSGAPTAPVPPAPAPLPDAQAPRPAPPGQAPADAAPPSAGTFGPPGPPPASTPPQGNWAPPPPPTTPSYAAAGSAGPGAPYPGNGVNPAASYGDNGSAGGPYADDGAGGASYADGGSGGGDSGWGDSYQQPAPKPRNRRGGLFAAVLVAALVAGGLGGGLGYTLAKDNDDNSSTTISASESGGSVKREEGSVADVADKALPSTVTIEAESSSGEGGTGTGFVFDTEGHILTNNHVVADAVDGGKLTATFPNGKKYNAEVVGHAQGYDVAVIKLKNAPSNLKPLTLGNSDKVAVGDSTIAIGAPYGLSNTVTTGIISAKNRPVASSDGTGSSSSYMSALQTDASINPGNSGGPLLDAQGNVIGINSAIQSTSSGGLGESSQSGSIGLGFAIPINQAKYVAQDLIETGKPVYAKIGASVSLEDTTDGAQITDQGTGSDAVEDGGPADKAGLEPGDVITKLDDQAIDSGPTLIGEIWTHKPGDKVTITYKRDGKSHTTELTLGSRTGDS